MVQAYEDAIECECFISGDLCVCEEECECGCPDCECQEWEDLEVMSGCACGGNCVCNQSQDEQNEGGSE